MSHRHTIESRIARLDARIRDTHNQRSIAVLVGTMTAQRDVEAIPVLVGLLGLHGEQQHSVERALVRYGEAAEDTLKAHALAHRSPVAIRVLTRISHQARLRSLGCF